MFDKLRARLLDKGFTPDAVLDIGAHHGHWTHEVRRIFPDASYYLFEGIDYPQLSRYKNDANVHVFNVLLNKRRELVDWYELRNTGDSFFKEKTYHFDDCAPTKRETIDLDTYLSEHNLLRDASHVFIKIDCQGAEIPILQGATDLLTRTDFVLLEIPFFGQFNEGVPTFLEHIAFMDSIGFVVYDMLENHYVNGFNMQVDLVFISKRHPLNTTVNERLRYK